MLSRSTNALSFLAVLASLGTATHAIERAKLSPECQQCYDLGKQDQDPTKLENAIAVSNCVNQTTFAPAVSDSDRIAKLGLPTGTDWDEQSSLVPRIDGFFLLYFGGLADSLGGQSPVTKVRLTCKAIFISVKEAKEQAIDLE